jgi:hypothetical protein
LMVIVAFLFCSGVHPDAIKEKAARQRQIFERVFICSTG